MPDPKIDLKTLRETTERVIRQQATGFPKLAKELDELQDALDKLEKTGADKAKVAEARKKRDAKRKQLEECMRNLDLSKAITKPIPKPADPKIDLKKLLDPLPDFAKEAIKREGLPLGRHGVLQPNVKFDFDKGKFTEGGATIKWKF